MAKGKRRDARKEAWWRKAVGRQRQSGLTIREFCRRRRLRETAFYFWRRELDRRDAAEAARPALDPRRQAGPARRAGSKPTATRPQAPRDAAAGMTPRPAWTHAAPFLPVRLAADAPAGGRIVIALAGGRRVHVVPPVDRQALADVLAVLSEVQTESEEAAAC